LSNATKISGIVKTAFTVSDELPPATTRWDAHTVTDAATPPSAMPTFAEVDEICLQLFDSWCEQRSVLPLAYLMHVWPVVGSTKGSSERLSSSLGELATYHPEALTSHELGLITRLIDLCRDISGVAQKPQDTENSTVWSKLRLVRQNSLGTL